MAAGERAVKRRSTKSEKPHVSATPKVAEKESSSAPTKLTRLSTKRKAVKEEVHAEPEQSEEEPEDAAVEEDEDDESSDEDASDEGDEQWSGIDVSTLPTIAKDDAVVKRKLEKAKRKPTDDRGVIYLGRIPHGFYEDQMKAYFAQFGDVTRLRLSRNKKTGRSKHYAFIEFDSSSVAQIVAETMDNYLLMGHIITCKVIPKDEVHPELWIGADRKFKKIPHDRIARLQHNKPRTPEELKKAEQRLLKRQAHKKRKLEESGINYDFDAVAYKKRPSAVGV